MTQSAAALQPLHSSPLGEIVSPHATREFPTLASLVPAQIEATREAVMAAISELEKKGGDLVLSREQAQHLSREILENLERGGIVPVRYSQRHPLGSYAMDALPYALPSLQELNQRRLDRKKSEDLEGYSRIEALGALAEGELIVLRNSLGANFGLVTQPAVLMTPDQRLEAGFGNVPTNAHVVAVCRKNKSGQWAWGPSDVYPDGHYSMPAMAEALHYGKSCFEGQVAMVNAKGEISLFRPEKNARRFIQSCDALGMPAPSVQQFLNAVKAAVRANRDYLPPDGSDAKLYIRPFAMGLAGGTSEQLGTADTYVFAVEVFPFGNYLGDKNATISLIAADRQRTVSGQGETKGGINYGGTALLRMKAKEGLMGDGRRYKDLVFFGLQEVGRDEERGTLEMRKVVDEASGANLFFIKKEADGQIYLYTPPLDRQAILAGITRDSVIQLAVYLGYQVREIEISQEDIKGMSGAFFTGTAAGAVRIGSITLGDRQIEFDSAPEDGEGATEITKAFFDIYYTLYAARKGELDPERFPVAKDWAMVIGKVSD